MTWTSDARSVNGWFCAAFGRRRARFEVTRMQSLDRARSQLSIKKRTTKKGGDGEELDFLAWVCSSGLRICGVSVFVRSITQLPLPRRLQYRDLVRMGVTLPCQSSRLSHYVLSASITHTRATPTDTPPRMSHPLKLSWTSPFVSRPISTVVFLLSN